MSDEQVRWTTRSRRSVLEAPERGSADELLDAGAQDELGAMRHSAAHVMAEAVLDLFPGTKLGIGPAIGDGFYYDFALPRPLTPDDLAGDRGPDGARASRPTTRSSAASCRRTRRAPSSSSSDQPFKVEILDDLAAAAERDGDADAADDASTSTARSSTCARDRTSRRTGKIGPFKLLASPARTGAATRSARCSSASTARSGRRRRTSTSSCGGARRRRSATTDGSASSSTCSASTTSARARRSGTRRASASGGRSRAPCASCRPGAATRRSARRSSSTRSCGSSPATGTSTTRHMFLLESEDQTSASSR